MAETQPATEKQKPAPEPGENSLPFGAELKDTVFDRAILLISSIAFCVVLLFVFIQVLIRFVTVYLGFSLPWTEEAARYVMIFFTFLGSAVACRKREHIVITSLVDHLPPKARLIQEIIVSLLIILFLGVAIIGTISYTVKMMVAPVGSISWLKVGHIYGSMTIALALIAVYQLRWLFRYCRAIFRHSVEGT